MNSESCTSLYFKNFGFKTVFNAHADQYIFAVLSRNRKFISPDTWRKEYKSRTFHPAAISRSCQERSPHMQFVQVGNKRNSEILGSTLEKNVPYSVFENTHFPYQTGYLAIE